MCTARAMEEHRVVSQEEWLAARKALLEKEKWLSRERDALAAERRALPWVKVEKSYIFDTPSGSKMLAELFDGRSQLLIYHLMFAPDWDAACLGCSYVADHFDGALQHLARRDVTLVAVSRAPLVKLLSFKQRMSWRLKWYSSFDSDFNRDFHVAFTKDELAAGKMYYNYRVQSFPMEEGQGLSAFYKDPAGNVFHTYSTYGRGVEPFINTYNFLDLAPKGRDELDQKPIPMAWVRHHDQYESDYFAGISASATPGDSGPPPRTALSAPAKSNAHDCRAHPQK
jgi:predicted dithiol-disulfide oxidoreductase (DUF899 family)